MMVMMMTVLMMVEVLMNSVHTKWTQSVQVVMRGHMTEKKEREREREKYEWQEQVNGAGK